MHAKFRIEQLNDYKDKYFPVKAFLNAIPDNYFLIVLANMNNGTGASFDEVHCEFPGDLEPDEEAFEGVMFSVLDEEIIIDHKTLYKFLQQASGVYLEDNSHDVDELNRLLEEFKETYN